MKIEFCLYAYLNGGNVMITDEQGQSSFTVFDSFEAGRKAALKALALWGGTCVTVDLYDTLDQFLEA